MLVSWRLIINSNVIMETMCLVILIWQNISLSDIDVGYGVVMMSRRHLTLHHSSPKLTNT